jgi:hypothetical protein
MLPEEVVLWNSFYLHFELLVSRAKVISNRDVFKELDRGINNV